VGGQDFVLQDTLRTIGKTQSIHIAPATHSLFVLQSFILTEYDIDSLKFRRVVDIIPRGPDMQSGAYYLVQWTYWKGLFWISKLGK